MYMYIGVYKDYVAGFCLMAEVHPAYPSEHELQSKPLVSPLNPKL